MGESPVQEADAAATEARRRQWRVERIGALAMSALVLAALLGLFGEGVLSTAAARPHENGFEVSYQRFERRGGSSGIDVDVSETHVRDGAVEVFLGDDLLEAITIERVGPTPTSVTAVGDGVMYEFAVDDVARAVSVEFETTPDALGWSSGTIRVPGAGSVSIGQFFFP